MHLRRTMHGLIGMIVLFGTLCHAATITGTLKGPDGAPVQGAFVEAQNAKTKITTMGVSDSKGHYRVEKLPAGEYRVQIREVGYRMDPRSGVNLTANQNASFDFALQKGDGALERPLHLPSRDTAPGVGRQGHPFCKLFHLPRIPNPHGFGHAGRGWLERPSSVHAGCHPFQFGIRI